MTLSIYQNPYVFEKHGPYFSKYIALCIRHHKDEIGDNTEFHHILPKHKGGSEDRWNKVHLEYELHVEAHRLLMKTFPDDVQMLYSYNAVNNRSCRRGKVPWNKGKTGVYSNEWIENKRKSMSGCNSPRFGIKGELHPLFGKEPWNKGKPQPKAKRVICKHCKKDVAVNIHAQFHGDKCKYKV